MLSKKRRTRREKAPRIVVSWEYVQSPDAKARLIQAYELLFRMMDEAESTEKKKRAA